MAIYLTFDGFKGLTVLPVSFVDQVERDAPGWVEAQLEVWARWIDARLRKRYATPFHAHDAVPDPTPPQIQIWLAQLVTIKVWVKRGVDPQDLQFDLVKEDRDIVRAEILEAANSEESWFDLPLRVAEDGTLITSPSPQWQSEQSPYVFMDLQSQTAINEDESGRPSSG